MSRESNRQEEFTALSKDHLKFLLFGRRIAEGLRNKISTNRLKSYADWVFENFLTPHFELEKEHIFPVLGLKNVRVKRALANHRRMKRLFNDDKDVYVALNRIEEEIGSFVRFEERVILKQIQERANAQQLEEIKKAHDELDLPDESWEDRFWEEN